LHFLKWDICHFSKKEKEKEKAKAVKKRPYHFCPIFNLPKTKSEMVDDRQDEFMCVQCRNRDGM
jgi:hypothetical protein